MTHHVLAFCGMPGTAADLEILQDAARELSYDLRVFGAASIEQAMTFNRAERPICVGYSRGCWNALQYASRNPAAKVLLIAPHWGNRVSPFVRLLLRLPLLGTILLCLTGPKRIQKMLRETAFPKDAPAAYKALEKAYARPSVLRHAMLAPAHSTDEVVSIIQSSRIPVYAIAGERDKALHLAEALRPWLNKLTIIPQAGHALPWTHGKECVKELI